MGLKCFGEIFVQRTKAFAHPFYLSTSNLTSRLLCLRGLLDEQVTCLALLSTALLGKLGGSVHALASLLPLPGHRR